MTSTEMRSLLNVDAHLTIGLPVRVYWGYGLGFRVSGLGRIVKLYHKSVRVQLDEDVLSPLRDTIGWHKGFTLHGIPRPSNWQAWNEAHCFELI